MFKSVAGSAVRTLNVVNYIDAGRKIYEAAPQDKMKVSFEEGGRLVGERVGGIAGSIITAPLDVTGVGVVPAFGIITATVAVGGFFGKLGGEALYNITEDGETEIYRWTNRR